MERKKARPSGPAADWLRQLHQVLMEGKGWFCMHSLTPGKN